MAHFHVLNSDVITSFDIPDKCNKSLHTHAVGEIITSAEMDVSGHGHLFPDGVTINDLTLAIKNSNRNSRLKTITNKDTDISVRI